MSSSKDEKEIVEEDDDESEEGDSGDDESEEEDDESEEEDDESEDDDDDDEEDDDEEEDDDDDEEEDGDEEEDEEDEDEEEEDDDEEEDEGEDGELEDNEVEDKEVEDKEKGDKSQEITEDARKVEKVEENSSKDEAIAGSEVEDKKEDSPEVKERAISESIEAVEKKDSQAEDKKEEETTVQNGSSPVDKQKNILDSMETAMDAIKEVRNTELKDGEEGNNTASDSQSWGIKEDTKTGSEEKENPNKSEATSGLKDTTGKSAEMMNGKERSSDDKLKSISESTELNLEMEKDDSELDNEKKEESKVEDVRNAFRNSKADQSKKSFWQLTRESFRWSAKKGDTINSSVDECVESLKTMVSEVEETDPKWQFTLTPLESLDATLEDLLRAFAMWSKKADTDDAPPSTMWSKKVEKDEAPPSFNATKAFARLGAYATWMEEHRQYLEKPLTLDSIGETAHLWQMKLTHSEKDGTLVCWLDVGALDLKAIKKSGHHASGETLRYIVWLCHVAMFDEKGQEKGMVIVESIGHAGTMESLTIIPRDLSSKLDHLTIGVLPVRLNKFYITKYQRWLSVMVGLMKPFLSKKMRQRIVMIPLRTNTQKFFDDLVGQDAIPVGFGGLEGKAENDIVFGKYLIE